MSRFWISVLTSSVLLCALTSTNAAFAQPAAPAGRKLIVGVTERPPFSMQEPDGNWSGFSVDLWKEIAKMMKVDYEFKKSASEMALLKAVADGEIDTAATSIVVTADEEKNLDFSDAYFTDNLTVAINEDQKPSLLQALRLTLSTWWIVPLLLAGLLVATGGATVLWLLERKGESEHYTGKTPRAFGKSLLWSSSLLLGQELPQSSGWDVHPPRTLAGRIFALAWMMAGTVLLSLFTAAVASVFTVKQLTPIVTGKDDLYNLRVGVVDVVPARAALDRLHIKYITYPSPLELLKNLKDHRIDAAIFGSTIMSYYAKNVFNGRITVLDLSLDQGSFVFPFKLRSDLRKPVNIALLQVIRSDQWHRTVAGYTGQ